MYGKKNNPSEFPYNIFEDMNTDYRKNTILEGVVCNPEGLIETLDTLPPRLKRVLIARYQENMTLSELATELEVTKERVRQLEVKAICKMKEPFRFEHCRFYGYNVVKNLNLRIWELEELLAETKVKLQKYEKEDLASKFENSPSISYLKLSTRSYNYLMKAGVQTISHLLNLSKTDILAIPGLGPISYLDISDCVYRAGFKFVDEIENT